jgi:hypothetical protein
MFKKTGLTRYSRLFSGPARVIDGLPEQMKAVHIRVVGSGGGPEALEMTWLPVPMPGAKEVLIKVAAAGVSRSDFCNDRA